MKKILLSIGAITSIVAPITAVVACGKNDGKLGKLSGPDESEWKNKINDSSDVKGLFTKDQLPVAVPYTPETLRAEATKIGDNSVWSDGLSRESLFQTIQFLRAFAETLGYDREKDFFGNKNATSSGALNLEIADKDISNPNLVNDLLISNSITLLDKSIQTSLASEIKDKVNLLKSFKAKTYMSPFDIESAPLASGQDNLDGDSFRAGIDWDAKVVQAGDPNKIPSADRGKKFPVYRDKYHQLNSNFIFDNDPNKTEHSVISDVRWGGLWYLQSSEKFNITSFSKLKHFNSWEDWKNPGDRVMDFIAPVLGDDNNGLHRTIINKGKAQIYPKIASDESLEHDYLPYVLGVLYSFASLVNQNSSTASGAFKYLSPEFTTILHFVLDHFTNKETHVLEIKKDEVFASLKKLNNGSQHLLAIKAFYNGFDKSFTLGDFVNFSTSHNTLGGWNANEDLNGLHYLADHNDIMKVGNWLYESNSWPLFGGRLPFVATMDFKDIAKKAITERFKDLEINQWNSNDPKVWAELVKENPDFLNVILREADTDPNKAIKDADTKANDVNKQISSN